jgi:hypothetical protein
MVLVPTTTTPTRSAVAPLHYSRSAILSSMDIMCLGNMVSIQQQQQQQQKMQQHIGGRTVMLVNDDERDDELQVALERSILQQRSRMQSRTMEVADVLQPLQPFLGGLDTTSNSATKSTVSAPTATTTTAPSSSSSSTPSVPNKSSVWILAHKNVMSDMELMCITNQIPFVLEEATTAAGGSEKQQKNKMDSLEQLHAIWERLQQESAIASSRISVLDESLLELAECAFPTTCSGIPGGTTTGGETLWLSSQTQDDEHHDRDGTVHSLLESIHDAVFSSTPSTADLNDDRSSSITGAYNKYD